jgi:DnaJ-class molecular chaperone
MIDSTIAKWMSVLDELTYYELFGLDPRAGIDELRQAYHAFCSTFHPDLHFNRAPDDHKAVSAIFKRGNEAYGVLSDVRLREQYDGLLMNRSDEKPRRITFSPAAQSAPCPSGDRPLEECVRSPSAKPFARRAQELLASGDLRQAKLQLSLASFKDPDNESLNAAMRDLERRIALSK